MYALPDYVPNRAFMAAFALTALALTLFFGGNFPFAMGLLPILCATMLGCAALLPRPTLAWSAFNWLLVGAFLPVGLVLLWPLVQIWPISPASQWANPYWSLVSTTTAYISVNPSHTLAQFGYAAGLLAMAWAVFRVGQSAPRPLLVVLAAVITFASVFGIIVFASGNGSVLWLPKTSYEDSLTSTFINRNSFATFAGLGIIANLALMLGRVGEISQRLNTRQRLNAFILLVLRPGWPWLCAALVCFIALVLTNSRAGLTSSICGVIVLLGSLAGMRPAARWPLVGMVITILVASFIILAAAGGTLNSRLNRVSDDAVVRSHIYTLSNNLISQYPVTGSGFGTYAESFSSVRTPELLRSLRSNVEHAHNTYIELASELGYPAMALLAVSVFSLLVAFLHGLRVRRRAIIWPAVGVSVLTLLGTHALVDFSLSIPAVAFASIAMLMLALAQSMPLKEQPAGLPPRHPHTLYTLIPCALALALLAGWQSLANYHALAASGTLRKLEFGEPVSRQRLAAAQRHLEDCLTVNPAHPACTFGLAQVYLSTASGYGLSGNSRGVALVYLNMAQQQYATALQTAPGNPLGWYRLARINGYLGEPEAATAALTNSLLTGPAEPVLAFIRVPLMLSLMPHLNVDDLKLYGDNILDIWRRTRWYLAPEIRANPSIQPALAELVKDEEDIAREWQRVIKTPFPGTRPLGEEAESK